MKTTRYMSEQVFRKRPYLTTALIERALESALSRERQEDGRIRIWGEVSLPDNEERRILRVVLLEDGETVHNVFFDRNYRE